jgi:hypothetical protein
MILQIGRIKKVAGKISGKPEMSALVSWDGSPYRILQTQIKSNKKNHENGSFMDISWMING